jgi:hypothetical protein
VGVAAAAAAWDGLTGARLLDPTPSGFHPFYVIEPAWILAALVLALWPGRGRWWRLAGMVYLVYGQSDLLEAFGWPVNGAKLATTMTTAAWVHRGLGMVGLSLVWTVQGLLQMSAGWLLWNRFNGADLAAIGVALALILFHGALPIWLGGAPNFFWTVLYLIGAALGVRLLIRRLRPDRSTASR